MKYASKKVELSFICERAPAKLLPKMHRRARWSRSVSDYDSKSISRASIERRFMSAIIQASPLEKLSQEHTAHRRFVCPHHFWSFGRSDQAKADPGPLQPGMCGMHEP